MIDDPRDSAPFLPPLDDEPGPMPKLSAAESEAIAWSVVSRWSAKLPGVEPADAELGPARPLSNDHAQRLARAVVTRRYPVQRVRAWLEVAGKFAAVAALSLSIGGVSFAAVRMWPSVREQWFGPAPLPRLQREAQRMVDPPSFTEPSELAPPPADDAPAPVAPRVSAPRHEPSPAAAQDKQDKQDKPEQLLERANALRAQRKWSAAERLYVRALSAGATEQQRYVALVAAASLALSHSGKPERALSFYSRALTLAPKGDLSEEARYGVAESYRALHDEPAETAALRTFVAAYPQSFHVSAARQRLQALSAHAQ